MIVATVQGTEKGGKHITVKDGIKIGGKEQQEAVDELYDKVRFIEIGDDDKIIELKKYKELFCYMEYPEVDASNRTGTAFIVWDKNTSEETIEKTIKEMGLDYKKFCELYKEFNEFKKKEEMKKQMFLLGGLGIGLAAGIIITTLTIIKN